MSLPALASAHPADDMTTPAAWAPYRVLIIDDEPLARSRLKAHLADHADFTVIGEGASGDDALAMVRALRPEIVFLDIEMPGRTGIEAWRDLGVTPVPALVFVTAYADFAVQGFELQAVDYLLKPFNRERFATTLARVRPLLREGRTSAAKGPALPERLVLKRDGEFHFVTPGDVVRIEAQGDFVKVYTTGGVHLVRQTLTRLMEQLPAATFIRVHRSHVINRAHLAKVRVCADGDYSVTVTGGAVVPVARAQTDVVRQLLD